MSSAGWAPSLVALCIIRALTAAIVRNYYNSTRQPGEEYDRPTDHIIDTLQESISGILLCGGILSVATVVVCGSFDVNVSHNFVNLIATEPVEYYKRYGGMDEELYGRGQQIIRIGCVEVVAACWGCEASVMRAK